MQGKDAVGTKNGERGKIKEIREGAPDGTVVRES